jgi:hypothetical protein
MKLITPLGVHIWVDLTVFSPYKTLWFEPVRTKAAPLWTMNWTQGSVQQFLWTLNWTFCSVLDGSGSNRSSEPNIGITTKKSKLYTALMNSWWGTIVGLGSCLVETTTAFANASCSSHSLFFVPPSTPFSSEHKAHRPPRLVATILAQWDRQMRRIFPLPSRFISFSAGSGHPTGRKALGFRPKTSTPSPTIVSYTTRSTLFHSSIIITIISRVIATQRPSENQSFRFGSGFSILSTGFGCTRGC